MCLRGICCEVECGVWGGCGMVVVGLISCLDGFVRVEGGEGWEEGGREGKSDHEVSLGIYIYYI